MIEPVHKYLTGSSAVKLAAEIEGLVSSGKLIAGSGLPSVRDLARQLKLSPGTIAATYRELKNRGVLETAGRNGTRVLDVRPGPSWVEPPLPKGAIDCRVANPDPKLLPNLMPFFRSLRPESDLYCSSHQDPELLRQMRKRFKRDGISEEFLSVASGALSSIHRALRACLRPGDAVVVEDPGFNEHFAVVRTNGLKPVPVEVDDEGMIATGLLRALESGVKAVILSSRFQSPTGATLSERRARALQTALKDYPEVLVCVDDYSGFIGTESYWHAVPATSDRWLVVRSFNKSIAPDLRVAVAACDQATCERMERDLWVSEGWVSGYLQRVAGAVLGDATVLRTLQQTSRVYRARRLALLDELRRRGIAARGASGLNVWIPVTDELGVTEALLTQGWAVRAGARYRIRSAPAIRVTIASMSEDMAGRFANDLEQVLRGRSFQTP